ncbi:30S ribosomal protein S17e [Candidatus Woesearchaeota archaeon]|nr:30S ribosomal protein S17e [Candidatus Woesearchaeota archaeon]
MGRIKTKKIKAFTEELVRTHGDKFKEDYNSNKGIIEEVADIPSKKMRNIIAGYVTRLTKTRKDL